MAGAREPSPLALTLGEPAGIGPDITLAAYAARREQGLSPFYLIGDAAFLRRRASLLGIDVDIVEATPEEAAAVFARALPVCPLNDAISGVPGKPDIADAPLVAGSIETAVEHVRAGKASAVVTNPISKAALYKAGFGFPGHTEYLADLAGRFSAGPHRAVMMLAGPSLRTVPVTIHIPLARVPVVLTTELIVETGRIVARDLVRRFGIAAPRLAVCGLNPHAGEDGAIGREDIEVVAPAVARLRSEGIDAIGPLPADTMFHAEARARFDAALGMYHDQALIPIKTLAFDEGVNVTLGLPFIRTSPDHGTAFELAGSGRARPDSLVAALRLAGTLAANEAARP